MEVEEDRKMQVRKRKQIREKQKQRYGNGRNAGEQRSETGVRQEI